MRYKLGIVYLFVVQKMELFSSHEVVVVVVTGARGIQNLFRTKADSFHGKTSLLSFSIFASPTPGDVT
jgi:hypothetical protein